MLDIEKAIMERVVERSKATAYNESVKEVVTGEDYEQLCKGIIERAGWTAQRTKATGDQGIDLVCEYLGMRLVLQCKFYSQPVGNSAVQEVVAGMAFYAGHVGAVVTNATFTPAARQLAGVNQITLLHHDDLEEFVGKLKAKLDERGQSNPGP
jgi:restriction system protein